MRRQTNSRSEVLFFILSSYVCACVILSVSRRVAVASTLSADVVRAQHDQPRCSSSRFFAPRCRLLSANSHLSVRINEMLCPPFSRQTSVSHANNLPHSPTAMPSVNVTQVNNDGKELAPVARRSSRRQSREKFPSPSQGDFRSRRERGILCISAGASLLQHLGLLRRDERRGKEERSSSCRVSHSEKFNSSVPALHKSSALSPAVSDKPEFNGGRLSRTCKGNINHIALFSAPELSQRKRVFSSGSLATVFSRFLRYLRHTGKRLPVGPGNSLLCSTPPDRHAQAVKLLSSNKDILFSLLSFTLRGRRYRGASGSSNCRRKYLLPLHIPCFDGDALVSDRSICSKTESHAHPSATSMRRKNISARDYVAGAVLEKLLASKGEGAPSPTHVKNDDYLLYGVLRITGMPYCVRVGEIPGDGDCLFTALAACLWYSMFGAHPSLRTPTFKDMTYNLRQLAVDTLEHPSVSSFTLEEDEEVSPAELVRSASETYGLSSVAYLNRLRLPGAWGGGPEIVALSHALKRTICVYEIDFSSQGQSTNSSSFTTSSVPDAGVRQSTGPSSHPGVAPVTATTRSAVAETCLVTNGPPQRVRAEALCKGKPLKLVACLGYPKNVENEPLHILFISSAAGSLTSSSPTCNTNGDHFMPLFPCLSQFE